MQYTVQRSFSRVITGTVDINQWPLKAKNLVTSFLMKNTFEDVFTYKKEASKAVIAAQERHVEL